MNIEGFLTKKMVWAANAVGLLLIWLGFVLILSGLVVTGGFAAFLIVTGATLGALASVTGALGSKRTTDLQNLGLLVWAGLLLAFGIGVAL